MVGSESGGGSKTRSHHLNLRKPKPIGPSKEVTNLIALDCEMVGVGAFGSKSVLASVSIINEDGNEIYFKCKQTTPLKKLMDAFCNRQGVSSNSVRFLFDGNRINETQTPQQVRCPSVARSLSCAAALHSLALPPLRRTQSCTP